MLAQVAPLLSEVVTEPTVGPLTCQANVVSSPVNGVPSATPPVIPEARRSRSNDRDVLAEPQLGSPA